MDENKEKTGFLHDKSNFENINNKSYFNNKIDNRGFNIISYGQRSLKVLLTISWISAAFTAFVSPYFVFAGILFGVLSNRIIKGSGNAAIITNIVLAAVNFIFGLLMMLSIGRLVK